MPPVAPSESTALPVRDRTMPLRAFFGHHKCATGWIDHILMEACYRMGIRLRIVHLPRHFEASGSLAGFVREHHVDFLSYTNANRSHIADLPLYRGFHVVRDPRDVIVSAYFSHLHSHRTDSWKELIPHRERLKTLDKEDGLFAEMEFSRQHLEEMGTWDYNRDDILELKMEDLTRNPAEGFLRIFSFLDLIDADDPGLLRTLTMKMNRLNHRGRRFMPGGMPMFPVPRVPVRTIPAATLSRIVQKKSFNRLAGGRKRGQENVKSHYRKGVPGDWKNHLSEAHIRYFKEHFGEVVIRLGYEQDYNW